MTKIAALSNRIQFIFILLTPFCLTVILVALFYGCERKPTVVKEQKPTVTIENLQTAYNKEMNLNRMYTLFANRCVKEKNPMMGSLYRAIAASEEIHASSHAALMRKDGVEPKTPEYDSVIVGNVLQTLKRALSSEDIEIGSMYPNLIRTAELEKYKEAQTQFEQCRDADARQEDLLKQASDRGGILAKTPMFVCPQCGYILNSDQTDQCPICNTTKDKFKKI
ncbi:MAG: rubrerythrin family protein [Bacteroidota bacterium]